jgi:hypothetical protein
MTPEMAHRAVRQYAEILAEEAQEQQAANVVFSAVARKSPFN